MFSSAPVFSPAVAVPVLMPTPQSGIPKWVWATIAGGVALVILMGVVLVVVLTRKPAEVAAASPSAPVAAAPAVPTTVVPAVAAKQEPPGAPKPGASATEKEKAAMSERPAFAALDKEREEKKVRHSSKNGSSTAPVRHERPAVRDDDAITPMPDKLAKKRGGDDLDSLLDSATGGRSEPRRAHETAAADDANLPDQLQRGDIVTGMAPVSAKVRGCFEQFKVPGTAMVKLVIGKSGKVQSATVEGALAGTPSGDCVARAVKSASFKRFRGEPMSITYPFPLR